MLPSRRGGGFFFPLHYLKGIIYLIVSNRIYLILLNHVFITAQQTKLDLELVPKENRLDIGKCNGRIPHGFSPREPTFQVTMDALALTLCYPAFLITADVPKVYMHQFWNYIYKHGNFYRFKIDKKKRFKLTLEVFREILQIFPRVHSRDFDPLPSKEDTVSFLIDLGHTGVINSPNDVVVDQMHQPWRTFTALINKSLSGNTTGLDKLRLSRAQIILGTVPPKAARKFKKASPSKKDNVPIPKDEEPIKKGKRLKTAAKKSTSKPATGIVIREPVVETKSKRKEKEKMDVAHGKGIELLSDGTVAEDPPSVAKITPPVTSEGTGDIPGVPDVTNDDSFESESESRGNDEDDSNKEHISSDEGSEEENKSDKQASNLEQEEESEDDDQEENKDDDDLELESNDETKGDEEMDDTTDQFDDDADARLEEHTETATGIVQGEDIPHTDAEIVSPLDVPVHHEVLRTQVPTLLPIPVSVIPESSPVFTNFPQSSHTFTPTPILDTHTPPPTIRTENPLSNLPDFSSDFRFNDRISALEKEVVELKKDPLHTQVTSLVDEHLDTRLGETREEFMNFLSESFTARIKEQVKDQLPQILPQEVSNFAPPVIKKLIHQTCDEVTLAKASSQPQSTYEAASTLTEFELKKILLEKMEKSESYLTAPKHREYYDGLKKSYAVDQDFFYSYDVYTLKCGRKDKDKDEDPSAGSDQGLKRRKTSKDAELTTDPKKKDSTSGSSKGTKSQPRSSGKSVQLKEPVFEVADSNMPQDQEGDMGDNEDEPRKETASRSDWFKKLTPVQEPTDSDWHVGKTTQEGPPQKWLMTLAASTLTDKSLKEFDELMSTPIDFFAFIMNGGGYPFDLSKPLLLITHGKRQKVPFEFFINNDLKYLQRGISTMTYTTSTTKTKAARYDLPVIEDMVPNIWSPVKVTYDKYALWGISHWREQRKSFYAFAIGMQSRGDVYSTKRILAVTHVSVMRKYGYGYLEEIVVRRADNVLYRFKEGNFPRLWINDIEDMLLLVVQNRLNNLSGDDVADFTIALIMHPYTPYKDPQGFIYVDDFRRNRLMHSDELSKSSDGTLTRLLSSLEDITKNIDMTYFPKRRWSTLEKKRAYFMIKDINKLLKERRMMRSLEKFIGGRLYGIDLRLLQRTI
ncbi:hypothetical protein Tco_1304625 [Tanacetum coccineum]